MVTITSGAHSESLEGLEGRQVSQIRADFRVPYNIAPDAVATLNGQRANEGDVLRDGDTLVFSRTVAQKG